MWWKDREPPHTQSLGIHMSRQQPTRKRYMIRARCVGTPEKKTPSLQGGEASNHSRAVAWVRNSSPQCLHTRSESLE